MLVFQSWVLILYKNSKMSFLFFKSKNPYWSTFYLFLPSEQYHSSNGYEISGGFYSNYFHNWLTLKLTLKPYYILFSKISYSLTLKIAVYPLKLCIQYLKSNTVTIVNW